MRYHFILYAGYNEELARFSVPTMFVGEQCVEYYLRSVNPFFKRPPYDLEVKMIELYGDRAQFHVRLDREQRATWLDVLDRLSTEWHARAIAAEFDGDRS